MDAADEKVLTCARCHGEVIEFSVPNEVWNAVIRTDGHERDDEYICIACWYLAVAAALRCGRSKLNDDWEHSVASICKACWENTLRERDERIEKMREAFWKPPSRRQAGKSIAALEAERDTAVMDGQGWLVQRDAARAENERLVEVLRRTDAHMSLAARLLPDALNGQADAKDLKTFTEEALGIAKLAGAALAGRKGK